MLAIIFVVPMVACSRGGETSSVTTTPPPEVTGIIIYRDGEAISDTSLSVSLSVGTLYLDVVIEGTGEFSEDVIWESSDFQVASFANSNNGVLTLHQAQMMPIFIRVESAANRDIEAMFMLSVTSAV